MRSLTTVSLIAAAGCALGTATAKAEPWQRAKTHPPIKVGSNLAPLGNEVPTDSHVIGEKTALGPPGNRGHRPAKSHIPVSPENPRTANVIHVPAQGGEQRHERVSQRRHVVAIAQKHIEHEWNVDGKISDIKSEFQSVPVVDVAIEIRVFIRFDCG